MSTGCSVVYVPAFNDGQYHCSFCVFKYRGGVLAMGSVRIENPKPGVGFREILVQAWKDLNIWSPGGILFSVLVTLTCLILTSVFSGGPWVAFWRNLLISVAAVVVLALIWYMVLVLRAPRKIHEAHEAARRSRENLIGLPPTDEQIRSCADALLADFVPKWRVRLRKGSKIGNLKWDKDYFWFTKLCLWNAIDVDIQNVRLLVKLDSVAMQGTQAGGPAVRFGPPPDPFIGPVLLSKNPTTGVMEQVGETIPGAAIDMTNTYCLEIDRLSKSFPLTFHFLVPKHSIIPTPSGTKQDPEAVNISGSYEVHFGNYVVRYEVDSTYAKGELDTFSKRVE
jgi:hypothetical protein